MKRIVVENLRSAYNVWNIIRTADALGWWIIFVWYTARPDHKEVKKTALWAESTVKSIEFNEIQDALYYMNTYWLLISAEISDNSIDLNTIHSQIKTINKNNGDIFVVVWNEVTGVEKETLQKSDIITHIPMLWVKESLNVGQAAAIIMRELS